MKPYNLSKDQLEQDLNTKIDVGLTDQEAKALINKFGYNKIKEEA